MQLLKFLLGIMLVQLITVVLVLLSPETLDTVSFLRLGAPLFFISLMVAFWFSSLAEHSKKDAITKLESHFAKERESILLNAEKSKREVEKEAQREIANEAKVTHAKANFKVGAAFAGVLGVGALFVFAQMITVGLLVMSATGGAIGGYYYRGKRIAQRRENLPELEVIDTKVIEAKPKEA